MQVGVYFAEGDRDIYTVSRDGALFEWECVGQATRWSGGRRGGEGMGIMIR